MAGRPRKPTDYLKLVGADKKNPKRFAEQGRHDEPVVTEELGAAPDCLNEAQKARWVEIAGMCPWLRKPDRIVVEETARLWQDVRDGKAKPAERKLLASNLMHLGMMPADRSKVKAPPSNEKPTNAFGKLG